VKKTSRRPSLSQRGPPPNFVNWLITAGIKGVDGDSVDPPAERPEPASLRPSGDHEDGWNQEGLSIGGRLSTGPPP